MVKSYLKTEGLYNLPASTAIPDSQAQKIATIKGYESHHTPS
jgi:hypothetical protein